MDWPSSPLVGQTVSDGLRTWAWTGAGWSRQVNVGQIVAVFTSPGITVTEVTELPNTDPAIVLVDYV